MQGDSIYVVLKSMELVFTVRTLFTRFIYPLGGCCCPLSARDRLPLSLGLCYAPGSTFEFLEEEPLQLQAVLAERVP